MKYINHFNNCLWLSVISWRGRISIKKYNPAKMTKYGILVNVLCEALTEYVFNFHVYASKGKNQKIYYFNSCKTTWLYLSG